MGERYTRMPVAEAGPKWAAGSESIASPSRWMPSAMRLGATAVKLSLTRSCPVSPRSELEG